LTLCECSPERLPCLVEYLKVTQQFPRPYARFTSYLYKVYETIPPLVTSWYTIWAKVIVIVATYRRVVTLIEWVSSTIRDRTCPLTFQESPRLFAPVLVGVPQGSPISPLRFVIYVSSLPLKMPWSLIISYVDDFALTVASPSYRTNVRLLQKSFSSLKRKASLINISFSVPKTELIHWRTARSNEALCSLPVQLEDQLFYPQSRPRWLGFIFTPFFNPRSHFSRRYTVTNTALATIRRLSPSRMGLPPHRRLSLACSLLAPILLYRSAV